MSYLKLVIGVVTLLAILYCITACESNSRDIGRGINGFLPPEYYQLSSVGLGFETTNLGSGNTSDFLVTFIGGSLAVVDNVSQNGQLLFQTSYVDIDNRQAIYACAGDVSSDESIDICMIHNNSLLEVYEKVDNEYQVRYEYEFVNGCSGLIIDNVNFSDNELDLLICRDSVGLQAMFFNHNESPYTLRMNQPVTVASKREAGEYYTTPHYTKADMDNDGLNDILLLCEGEKNSVKAFMHGETPGLPQTIWDPEQGIKIPRPENHFDPENEVAYWPSEYEFSSDKFSLKKIACGKLDIDDILDVVVLVGVPGGVVSSFPMQMDPNDELIVERSHYIYVFRSTVEYPSGYSNESTNTRYLQLELVKKLCFPGLLTDVKIADINYDGYGDVICTSEGHHNNSGISNVGVFYGNGAMAFNSPFAFQTAGPPIQLEVCDLDGDTFSDVVTLLPWTNELEMRLNDGGSGLGEVGISLPFEEE